MRGCVDLTLSHEGRRCLSHFALAPDVIVVDSHWQPQSNSSCAYRPSIYELVCASNILYTSLRHGIAPSKCPLYGNLTPSSNLPT